ncbi:MAG: hypothetical protein GY792_13130 [Gammaproteobacteria bacterium]|nr:hypothetical protein [Gammaproteobacteria bacterium]
MAEARGQLPNPPDELDELSFSALRRLGIALAQELAAESWTDYNLHDPGVTLLEQICYALTDLVYRTEFDVADHLSSPDGEIDFERLGLELPEHIFPCRPTTVMDYRRAILDKVAAIDDVTIRPKRKDAAGVNLPNGLYEILLRPRPGTGEKDRARIRTEVERSYSQLRNLCEDVQEITFVSEIEFEVHAVVEAGRGRDPEEILAEVYHRCAEQVASRARFYPFENARRADLTLEDVLTGPLGQSGYCDEEDFSQVHGSYSVSDFFNLISQVEGVTYVHDLYFSIDGKTRRDSIRTGAFDQVLWLHIPSSPDQVRIQLYSLGRTLNVPFESFRNRLDLFMFKGAGSERAFQDVRKLYSEPRGEHRDLRQYTSIQTHLPSIYRVGDGNLSESVAPDDRARSRQLKGYLLLFDQMMANSAAQTAGLKDLFSRDGSSSRSYASQALEREWISNEEEIYPPQPADVIASAVARYDDVNDRKGRLLDYLLALYGESISQHSLRTFSFYVTPGERERALVENKARFLHAIAGLTRDRGAASDYPGSGQATVSGLQQRVSCLLGFVDYRHKVLTAAFREHGLRPLLEELIPDQVPEEERPEAAGPSRCSSTEFKPPENPWEDEVPLLAEEFSAAACEAGEILSRLMDQVGHLLPRSDGNVQAAILRSGISLGNYRLGQAEGGTDWQVFLLPDADGAWWRLGVFASRHDAIVAVNSLRRLIVLLNTESEGMHVIEHILLRPRNDVIGECGSAVLQTDFYSLRLSVVFPAWTARFQDQRFRHLARETVRLNCPAQVVPEVMWLGFDDMQKFEQLQSEWLQVFSDEGTTAVGFDAAAARLIEFLIAHRGEACWALASTYGSDKVPGE